MRLAFVVYDGLTALDLVGAYDPLTRIRTMGFDDSIEWEFCALNSDIHDIAGLGFQPTQIGEPLSDFDLLLVPGGYNIDELLKKREFIEWIQTAEDVNLKASVCTGSLILGAAGFLSGRTATTHPTAYDDLERYCETVVSDRVVDDDGIITARGVSSSIDLGLYLCERIAGAEIKEQIREQMDYQ